MEFGDDDTETIFRTGKSRKFGTIARPALRKLRMMEAATSLQDLRTPPGNRLEKLTGDRAGSWSIRINQQWRITFTPSGDALTNIRIEDYH